MYNEWGRKKWKPSSTSCDNQFVGARNYTEFLALSIVIMYSKRSLSFLPTWGRVCKRHLLSGTSTCCLMLDIWHLIPDTWHLILISNTVDQNVVPGELHGGEAKCSVGKPFIRLVNKAGCFGVLTRLFRTRSVMGRLWDDHFRDLGYPPKFYRGQDAGFDNGSWS